MKKTGLNRDLTDKFYTKPEVAKKCVEEWKKLNIPKEHNLVIEPSAGCGSFTNLIHEWSSISYDIAPAHEKVREQDFLKLDLNLCFHMPCHYIGNPPFGRQSSLAKKFIKKICEAHNTKTFSFILPKSFKKESMQRCIPLNFHLVSQIDIEMDAFTVDGKDYNVPCVFQVWEKRDTAREVSPILEPKGYEFVKRKEEATFALRRVGVYAGKMIDMLQDGINFEQLSDQSHYYIKFNKTISFEDRDKFKENYYNTITWNHDNTVGPKSIGKQEFIRELNKLF